MARAACQPVSEATRGATHPAARFSWRWPKFILRPASFYRDIPISTAKRALPRAVGEVIELARFAFAARILSTAWAEGRRTCVLGCGQFAEGDALTGRDLSNVTVVEQDAATLDAILLRHHHQIVIERADPIRFLSRTIRQHEQFDLIYSIALPEMLGDQPLSRLIALAHQALAPGGVLLLANQAPPVQLTPAAPRREHRHEHWQPRLRSEADLVRIAGRAGQVASGCGDARHNLACARVERGAAH